MQSQIFHKHFEFTLLLPFRINFPYPKSFFVFPEFFLRWCMYSIFPINTFFLAEVELNTLNPISCLSFLYVPCHFTMNGEQFISQWNYLNLWRLALCFPLSKIFAAKKVASSEKSWLVENGLKVPLGKLKKVMNFVLWFDIIDTA